MCRIRNQAKTCAPRAEKWHGIWGIALAHLQHCVLIGGQSSPPFARALFTDRGDMRIKNGMNKAGIRKCQSRQVSSDRFCSWRVARERQMRLTICYPSSSLPCSIPQLTAPGTMKRSMEEHSTRSLSETERRWGKRQGVLNLHSPGLRRDGGVYDWRDAKGDYSVSQICKVQQEYVLLSYIIS